MRLAAQVRMAAQAWMWEAWMREAAASAGARGEAQVMGPSVRARRRLVWLGARRGDGHREGGALALSEPQWCVRFLADDVSHDSRPAM